jgi:hypothetical protein
MAELFFTLGVVCFVLAGIGLVITTILFFKLDVRALIAELSGKTATDAIAQIRKEGSSKQHKGRSLQSILDDTGAPSTNVPNGNTVDAERPTTLISETDIDSNQISESETSLLKEPTDRSGEWAGGQTKGKPSLLQELSKKESALLGRLRKKKVVLAKESSELETGLLDAGLSDAELLDTTSEHETQLLGTTTEGETQLLSTTTEGETQLLDAVSELKTGLLGAATEAETELLATKGKQKTRHAIKKSRRG